MAWTLSDFDNTKWIHRDINAYYIDSQNGNDLNDGHPERNYKTIEQSIIDNGNNATVILAPGSYYFSNISYQGLIIGDVEGLVIVDGNLASNPNVFQTLGFSLENLTIKNYPRLWDNVLGGQVSNAKNCHFENITVSTKFSNTSGADSSSIKQCSFKYCNNVIFSTATGVDFINSIIGGSIFSISFIKIMNCDLDSNSNITLNGSKSVTDAIFDFCNVRGTINGLTASAYKLANPTQLQNSKTAPDDNSTNDPERINEASGDLSLSLTSPNRNGGSNGLHIGSVGVGVGAFGLSDFTNVVNAQWDAINLYWEQIDPILKATVESVIKDLGDFYSVNLINVFGFNDNITNNHIDETLPFSAADVPSGSILEGKTYIVKGYSNVQYNGNNYQTNQTFIGVAGVVNYAQTGTGTVNEITELPDQRILEIRYGDTALDVASATYKRFIIGYGLFEDNLGNGSGDNTFDFDNQTNAVTRFVQFRISMQPKQ